MTNDVSSIEQQLINKEKQILDLQTQLNNEKQKTRVLLTEKSEFENSLALKFVRWLWRVRLALIPDRTVVAKLLGFGKKGQTQKSNVFTTDTPQENVDLYKIANGLNDKLYNTEALISTEELMELEKSLHTILHDNCNFSPVEIKACLSHCYRFLLTIKALEPIIRPQEDFIQILEMGEPNPFSYILRSRFPKAHWQYTQGDLREKWNIRDASVDLIVSTEVLEHLQDLPSKYQESFLRSGLKVALHECFRVLKPGGRLFCTTPNGASIIHLHNCLIGKEAWIFSPHIREYIIEELVSLFNEAGFIVDSHETVHCMTIDNRINYTSIFYMLLENNFITDDRGDDIFLIAHK